MIGVEDGAITLGAFALICCAFSNVSSNGMPEYHCYIFVFPDLCLDKQTKTLSSIISTIRPWSHGIRLLCCDTKHVACHGD